MPNLNFFDARFRNSLEKAAVARLVAEGPALVVHGAEHVGPGGHEDDQEGEQEQPGDELSLLGRGVGRGRPRARDQRRGRVLDRRALPGGLEVGRGLAGARGGVPGDEVVVGLGGDVHEELRLGAAPFAA